MIKLTAKVVSAYLSNNRLTVNELPDVIRVTFSALAVASSLEPETVHAEPVVPVRKSVTPDLLFCLQCGRGFSMLKRHLQTDHETMPDEYRAKWGLPTSYPMVAPNYAARRSDLAKKIGLGQSRKKVQVVAEPVAVEKPKHGQRKVETVIEPVEVAVEQRKRGRPRKAAAE